MFRIASTFLASRIPAVGAHLHPRFGEAEIAFTIAQASTYKSILSEFRDIELFDFRKGKTFRSH